jgi:hypothetical protein
MMRAANASTRFILAPRHSTVQVLHFYHATQYLAAVAEAAFARNPTRRTQWLPERCHDLQHNMAHRLEFCARWKGFLSNS